MPVLLHTNQINMHSSCAETKTFNHETSNPEKSNHEMSNHEMSNLERRIMKI